jgi:hypothetical protein
MIDIWRLDQQYQELRVQVVLGKIKGIEMQAVPLSKPQHDIAKEN